MTKSAPRLSQKEQLDAWQLWKQICSISGCDPSSIQPQDRETDPKRRAMFHQYLMGQFCKSFNIRYSEIKYEKLPTSEVVSFLDCCIAEFAPRIMKQDVHHLKCFKDFVWLKAQDADNPLCYIAGMLIGPRSYMNDFVRDYLNKNTAGHCEWDQEKRGYRYGAHESLDEVDANGDPLIENISDPNELFSPDQNLPDEENALLKKLTSELSRREKVVLLAASVGIALYSPEVTTAAGIGRDGCYLAFQKAERKICEMLKEVNEWHFAIRELISMIFDSLKSEKSLESFLLKVSDNNSTKETDHE